MRRRENILCLTFTNKAANEMKDRIQSLVGSPAKAVEVSTFHSFCFSCSNKRGSAMKPCITDVTIFDEEDCKELSEPYRPGKLREMSLCQHHRHGKRISPLYGFYSDDLVGDYKRTIERLQRNNVLLLSNSSLALAMFFIVNSTTSGTMVTSGLPPMMKA